MKKVSTSYLFAFVFGSFLFPDFIFSQTETQSTHDNVGGGTGTQISAATVSSGTTQVPIYGLGFNVTSGSPSFSAVTFSTSGSYVATDIVNFKFWECNFDVFPSGSQVQRGSTITTTLGPGSHTFSALGISIATGSSHAFYITVDIAAGAVNGHTIICNQITQANTTITGTNTYGTNLVGGTQTISALPIEMLSFTGKKSETGNILDWITASEIGNDFFTLERSADGISFTELTRIKGAGNSSAFLHYSATDAKPYPSITYYRLKQTDFNGDFTYSSVISISDNLHPPDIFISPNPAENELFLNFYSDEEKDMQVEIFNLFAQRVVARAVHIIKGEGYWVFDVGALPQGVYLFNLNSSSFKKQIKFIKL
ncbi:MAG: T9SS type A sorting domain-containing protein [Bacteroidetes bacterium]|nr:T9SS type A sorting domain-containing protein [Bacteroidota bacterium]